MVNDPILKCVVVELSNAIEEVELMVDRHAIIKILDETAQRISSLAVPRAIQPVLVEPEPKPEPVAQLVEKAANLTHQQSQTLLSVYRSNMENAGLRSKEYYVLNKNFYRSLYGGTNNLEQLRTILSTLHSKGYLRRIGHRKNMKYYLSAEGIKAARELSNQQSMQEALL